MSTLSSVGTIQRELAVRLNEVSADEADVYLGWINATSQDISLNLDNVRYLEASADRTLSSGTRIYALPSDFSQMYSVTLPASDTKLTFVPKAQFDALQPSATEGGDPTLYTIYLENIEFYPSPNSSRTVHYNYAKVFSDVSAASAALPIPNAYLEMYVNRGVAYGLERRGDFLQAQIFHNRYEALLVKMNQDLKSVESLRMKSIREFRGSNNGLDDKIINFRG